jgi:hypothetical protein
VTIPCMCTVYMNKFIPLFCFYSYSPFLTQCLVGSTLLSSYVYSLQTSILFTPQHLFPFPSSLLLILPRHSLIYIDALLLLLLLLSSLSRCVETHENEYTTFDLLSWFILISMMIFISIHFPTNDIILLFIYG